MEITVIDTLTRVVQCLRLGVYNSLLSIATKVRMEKHVTHRAYIAMCHWGWKTLFTKYHDVSFDYDTTILCC